VFKPQNLEDAFDQACNLEGVVDFHAKRFKLLSKPLQNTNIPKLSNLEVESHYQLKDNLDHHRHEIK
jgi:hypothetical protein